MSAMEGVELAAAQAGASFEAESRAVIAETRQSLNELRDIWAAPEKPLKNGTEADLIMRCSLLMLELKRISRETAVSGKALGKDTLETKQRIDGLNLQLQNLLYERDHLNKEIKKCRDFKSADQGIELISEEQLLSVRPEAAVLEPHGRMLSRLNLELEERKRLGTVHADLVKRKQSVTEEIAARRKTLDGVSTHLEGVLKATAPLGDFLAAGDNRAPVSSSLSLAGNTSAASLLPRSLYIVYVHASACASAFGTPKSISIVGDLTDARSFNDANTENLWRGSDALEDEDDTEEGAVGRDDTGQPAQVRRRRNTTASMLEERKKALIRRHPLSVEAVIECVEGISVTVRFEYVPVMAIVTAHAYAHDPKGPADRAKTALTGDALLAELYPGDSGLQLPTPSAYLRLDASGLKDLDAATFREIGRPFRWAQWIGGLDALPPPEMLAPNTSGGTVDALPTSRHHTAQIFAALRERVAARVALYGLGQKLLARAKEVPLTPAAAKLFNLKPLSSMADFREISEDEFRETASKRAGSASEHYSGVVGVRYFRATFTRDTASLSTVIAVHPAYPLQAPIFRAWFSEPYANNVEDVRTIEREVNGQYPDITVGGEEHFLLANQLRMLQMCFDIFVETEKSGEESSGRIFLRKHKGRDRARPFKFNHLIAFFNPR